MLAKPASGNLFGNTTTSTGSSSTPATPAPGAGLFGQPANNAQQTSTSNPSTPAPTFGGSGGLFGQKPADQNTGTTVPKVGCELGFLLLNISSNDFIFISIWNFCAFYEQ